MIKDNEDQGNICLKIMIEDDKPNIDIIGNVILRIVIWDFLHFISLLCYNMDNINGSRRIASNNETAVSVSMNLIEHTI